MNPRRGELYWVDFHPSRGVEQAGRRPALVIQNDIGNQHSPYTVVVALSTAPLKRVYPFTVLLAVGEAGLPQLSHVNCAQLLTVDQSRLGPLIGKLSDQRMEEVSQALRYQLSL
jgi:mRNA interferase MazF